MGLNPWKTKWNQGHPGYWPPKCKNEIRGVQPHMLHKEKIISHPTEGFAKIKSRGSRNKFQALHYWVQFQGWTRLVFMFGMFGALSNPHLLYLMRCDVFDGFPFLFGMLGPFQDTRSRKTRKLPMLLAEDMCFGVPSLWARLVSINLLVHSLVDLFGEQHFLTFWGTWWKNKFQGCQALHYWVQFQGWTRLVFMFGMFGALNSPHSLYLMRCEVFDGFPFLFGMLGPFQDTRSRKETKMKGRLILRSLLQNSQDCIGVPSLWARLVSINLLVHSIPVEFFVTKSDAPRPLQNGFWLPYRATFWPWVLPSCKWTPPWYRNFALEVRVCYPPVPTILSESGGLINNHYKLDGFNSRGAICWKNLRKMHKIWSMIAIVFIMSCPPIPTQEVCSNMFQQNKKVSKTQK